MKVIGQWILLNPSAVKAYLVAILALVAKGILAVTGKVQDLGQWSGFVDQAIDLLVGGLSIWGVISGSIHATRGAQLTSVEHVAAVVAAIVPIPPAVAVDKVQTIIADVVALPKASPAETVESPHRF